MISKASYEFMSKQIYQMCILSWYEPKFRKTRYLKREIFHQRVREAKESLDGVDTSLSISMALPLEVRQLSCIPDPSAI